MTKFVCISDTHNQHYKLDLPKGDILLHAGDMTMMGRVDAIKRFNEYLGTLNYRKIVIIAGNHDWLFETQPKEAEKLITNAIYLKDSEIIIDGIKIYGSPWQPWFGDWAFNLRRGLPLKKKWNLIPKDVDILMTHGPPYSYLDKNFRGEYTGCQDLLYRIRVIAPKYHVFGHIHEGYGTAKEDKTTFINASVVDVHYRMVNDPIVFEL
ncbi:MAG: metallophosphoesterase [Candidatus Lokiarchaeota archaeon]|nr:metallophosphoesterase [Candidatus Lokiarchaeota archaeon]